MSYSDGPNLISSKTIGVLKAGNQKQERSGADADLHSTKSADAPGLISKTDLIEHVIDRIDDVV